MVETTRPQTLPTQKAPEPTRETPTFQPLFDILETENELTLYGDLPGVGPEGLDIKYLPKAEASKPKRIAVEVWYTNGGMFVIAGA